jgi:hypothetical protein
MTKGGAYRSYYEANRERILERNRERNRALRLLEKTDEEVAKERERQRLSYHKCKAKGTAAVLNEEADRLNNFWSPFLRAIAADEQLSKLNEKGLSFILGLPGRADGPPAAPETISLV